MEASSHDMLSNNRVLSRISGMLDKISYFSLWGGMIVLFSLMIFTFVAVVMRYIFNRPFGGDLEITQLMSVLIIWLGIAWGQVKKSHISVAIITSRLSPRNLLVFETATLVLLLGVAGVITWQGILNVLFFMKVNKTSQIYLITLSPIAVFIPFGSFLYFLVLLRDFVHNLYRLNKERISLNTWVLMLGIPVCLMVLEVIFMQPMLRGLLDRGVVAAIGMVFGLGLIFLGVPIGPALAMTGFVFVGHLINPTQGLGLAGADLFWISTDYGWSTIILFMLMSEFIVISGIGAEAFDTAYKWIGHFRGGLAIATIGACTILAAVIGIPTPAIIAMGGVALPAMRKHKYADRLAAGSIASGASLGPLIPPSVSFIIYGIFTGVPISELFIAGIIPGMMLALGFMLTVHISCRLNPDIGEAGEKSGWDERSGSLKKSLPILILIIVVLGGIYFGVFTTTEGGGIGAFMALVIVFALRRLTWDNFKNSFIAASRNNSVMIFMVIGSMLFGRILTVSNLGGMMEQGLQNVAPSLIVVAILTFYFLIGLVADTVTVLILTLPILTPILKSSGIDMLWFGVVLIMMINLGAYTPPYGINLFILTSTTDVKLGDVFRGVLPFAACNLVVFLFLCFFPSVVTWLPNLVK